MTKSVADYRYYKYKFSIFKSIDTPIKNPARIELFNYWISILFNQSLFPRSYTIEHDQKRFLFRTDLGCKKSQGIDLNDRFLENLCQRVDERHPDPNPGVGSWPLVDDKVIDDIGFNPCMNHQLIKFLKKNGGIASAVCRMVTSQSGIIFDQRHRKLFKCGVYCETDHGVSTTVQFVEIPEKIPSSKRGR